VSRRAARRPVEHLRHQRKTGRRIVAHGRDLGLSPNERACVLAHPQEVIAVDDVGAEYERLRASGVRFTRNPLEMQSVRTAVFDDTWGNLIQIASQESDGAPAA
jgi:predicted enzyme related to lactoylglutathione lyase